MKTTLGNIWKILSANKTVRKSSNAFFVTLVGGVGTALIDGELTALEVGAVVGVTLVATSAVWKGTNERPSPEE